jgi:signal transduction histidine kinase/tetratricopeptide (TPR) repeat protein
MFLALLLFTCIEFIKKIIISFSLFSQIFGSLMFKSVAKFVFAIVLSAFALAGCENNSGVQNLELRTKIDSAIAHIQPQTDTGYHTHYYLYKKSLDSLEIIAKKADYHNALGRIYFMVGSMSRWEENFDTALVWLKKSYNEVKGTNTLEEINTLLEIGDVYLATGKKKLANDYYYNAKFISEQLSSTEATAKTFERLAYVFYHQNSYNDALKMYKKTLMYNRVTKYMGDHKTLEMRLLNNIGVCYYKLKNYDSALMYYDSALIEANRLDETPNTVAKGVFMGNKGRIYQLKKDYKKAIELLTTNTKINGRPGGDRRDAITSFTYLGEIYNALDSNEQFTVATDSAIKYTYIIRSSDALKWRAHVFGLKADFYAKLKKNELAYSYRTKQYILQDSINRADEKEDIRDVILYRELKENEKELLSLKEDNKNQKTRIFIYLTMVVLGMAMLIIAAIALINYRKNLKKQRKLNQQISEQNLQIVLSKRELEQAIEELTHLNAEKNKLLGMVAHDLRGPIYNITGVVQLLESSEQYNQFDEAALQLVDLIKKSCDNALAVINDLLDAAKLENGGLRGEMKAENLNEVIKDAIRLYQNRANQKQIQIEFSKPETNVEAVISKEKINRAIGNLLSNAIKFSKPKSEVNVLLTKTESNVIITVSDSGIGIPQADREFIFDKFTKAKRPGTDGEKPVGLGMSIVKQIVEAHNGRIWFESEVGKGTTFYIELPIN